MIATEVEVKLDSTQFSHETHIRTAGIHQSHIIKSIADDVYGQFKGSDIEMEMLEGYRTLGFLFERVLYDIILKADGVERLGEFEQDGIILTPDAVNLLRGRGIESKATFRSMKHDVLDVTGEFWEWWVQMKGYAKVLNLYLWDLYVLFIRGDYAKNRAPVLRHWEIEFDQEEVEANWRRLTNHKQWMIETGRI